MKKLIGIFVSAVLISLVFLHGADAMTVREFYSIAKKHKKHINPFAVTAQSACETGHWTSVLWKNGYNGAGLKVNAAWLNAGKPYITKASVESKNGVYGNETSKFRKYSSPSEFLKDYEKKIREDYPRCRRNHDNIWGYFAGLYCGRLGKWATDHKYYEKLTIKAVKLAPEVYGSEWKKKLIKDFKVASRRKSLERWQSDIIRSELRKAGVL